MDESSGVLTQKNLYENVEVHKNNNKVKCKQHDPIMEVYLSMYKKESYPKILDRRKHINSYSQHPYFYKYGPCCDS